MQIHILRRVYFPFGAHQSSSPDRLFGLFARISLNTTGVWTGLPKCNFLPPSVFSYALIPPRQSCGLKRKKALRASSRNTLSHSTIAVNRRSRCRHATKVRPGTLDTAWLPHFRICLCLPDEMTYFWWRPCSGTECSCCCQVGFNWDPISDGWSARFCLFPSL